MKVDEYNRLTGILLEMNPELKDFDESIFEETEKRLKSLTLSVRCGPRLNNSFAHQACLITVVNCGKRSFQGGVFVKVDNDCTCILPGFEGKPLSEVIKLQGGIVQDHGSTKTLFIGETNQSSQGLHLVFSTWAGGFLKEYDSAWDKDVSFPLGAIGAAALGVAASFSAAMGIEPLADWRPQGISFWNPDRPDWQTPDPSGPTPEFFPKSLWLLGLGHLGQAYTWTIGLMPFKDGRDSRFLLQDYDIVTHGNYEAGMLCERSLTNVKKARIVGEFLEKRGHKTSIVERRYTNAFARLDTDPEIMVSGLDNVASRRNLRIQDFKGVLDFGLGGNLGTFDLIRFHNLPFAGMPNEIWPESGDQDLKMDALEKLTKKLNDCGFVKGIAVSFVGVFASCLAISEILRAYHQGPKVVKANISLRQLSMRNLIMGENYKFEFFSGQVELKTPNS